VRYNEKIDYMIKAVIFDIDGVLLDSFETHLKFFQNLMVHFGYDPPTREEYVEVFHLTLIDAIKNLTGSTDDKELDKIFQVGRKREVPYPTHLLNTPEGTEDVLKKMSQNYSLGIVTSRVKENVYTLPQLAKIQKYFQATVSFDDTIKHKPDPEPLLLAARKLNVKPEESVYIGDVKNDVVAARAAGMKVIVYSKTNIEEADYCTDSFRAIPKLVASLN